MVLTTTSVTDKAEGALHALVKKKLLLYATILKIANTVLIVRLAWIRTVRM